jgi:choline dehydrogenase-like flavoprotein
VFREVARLEVITPRGETTLEADVVVVGSGSGGGVAAALLAEAGKRVIILEGGGYSNESDFVQSELAAYQNLFLRCGFFPSADGMVSIAAGSTVGGGSTVNWSNSLLTPNTVRACWADAGLEDVNTPAFDEHLQAVFDRVQCNDKVATQNGPHARLHDGASQLGYSYRVATLNIDPEKYDPNLIGYSGMVPIGPGGTPVFSAHQMCSAKLGSDPQTSVAKPNGELHDIQGVWIADASGMPSCSGVNPTVSTMALARRTAVNMLDHD